MADMLLHQTIPTRSSNMNLFRKLIDFLEGNAGSLRFDVVSNRLHDDLRYKTIADSKQEMREDLRCLRHDINKTIKASVNGKESRTEQN